MKALELTDEELDMIQQGLKRIAFDRGTPESYRKIIASAHAKVTAARKEG